MEQLITQKNDDYAYNKKVMMRYAQAYAKKNGEKALTEEQVEDVLTGLVAVAQAFLGGSPRAIARAMIELGHLAKKYGAKLVERFYHNFRERQRRKENGKNSVLPTEKKLKEFSSAY